MRLLIALLLTCLFGVVGSADENALIEPVRPFVSKVVQSLDDIPSQRRAALAEVSGYVAERVRSRKTANLVFICTHNSRRSHLSQVWCQLAAEYYGIPQLKTSSGGTETTACNIRTVRAMRRAGLSVVASTDGKNPVYLIQYSEQRSPISAFSKKFQDAGNPDGEFAAVMCCADADEKCPTVPGAEKRFPLHYDDPKAADNTDQESARYDERNMQIATEMFYLVSLVEEKLRLE